MSGSTRHNNAKRTTSAQRPTRRAVALLLAGIASAGVLAGAGIALADSGVAASGAAHGGTVHDGTTHDGTVHTGPANTGPANTGPVNTGLANTGLANTGLANTGTVHGGAAPTAQSAVQPGTSAATSDAGAPAASGSGNTRLAESAQAGGRAPVGVSAAAGQPALTASERRSCPARATACVDLAAHLTWLQSHGAVTFGPVRMEPGPSNTANATPVGTFHVEWKAGPGFVSNEYGDPMPWATFFAPGGIAFHGGSLTKASHGCVHLTVANAHYYHDHLPIGAEVAVF